MKKLSPKCLMDTAFTMSLEHEELLLKKYSQYIEELDNKELKKTMKEFKKTSREHVKLIKDLMIQLNLEN